MNIKLINHSTPFLAVLCISHLILTSCSSSPVTVVPSTVPTLTSATDIYWPTKTWRTSSPEEQGMNSSKLTQMLATIQQKHLNLHSLLVIRNGYLVSETYFDPTRMV